MARAGFQVIEIGDLYETDIIGVSFIGAPLHSITAKECVDRFFDTCVVVATYLESSCYTFRLEKPFRSDSNALQPRSEPPLSVSELVRVQEETLGGLLCINILIRCEILGVPVALEAADNSRFWQAVSTQCAGFDVGIFALCMIGGAHSKRILLVGRRLPGILAASGRCDALHARTHKRQSPRKMLSRWPWSCLLLFTTKSLMLLAASLVVHSIRICRVAHQFDMQSSITQAALRLPRGAKDIPMLPEYLQIIVTEVSGERAAALLAYIRKNPSGECVPHGATLLRLLDHRSNISRAPILALIRMHVSSLLSAGSNDMMYIQRWHRARYGRVLVGSEFANPFNINQSTDINMCLYQIRRYQWSRRDFPQCLGVVAGKRISPCHGEILIDEFIKFFKYAHGPYTAVWSVPWTTTSFVEYSVLVCHQRSHLRTTHPSRVRREMENTYFCAPPGRSVTPRCPQ